MTRLYNTVLMLSDLKISDLCSFPSGVSSITVFASFCSTLCAAVLGGSNALMNSKTLPTHVCWETGIRLHLKRQYSTCYAFGVTRGVLTNADKKRWLSRDTTKYSRNNGRL